MLSKTKQERMPEMRDESQHQLHTNEARRGDSQFQRRPVGQGRITGPSLSSGTWQKNAPATEWLSTSIVHDLRNPLAAVYAAAEMLVDLDPGTPQAKRLANNIYRAACRMQELLADLKRAARGDTVTAEMCDIRKVITAASDAATTATENSRVLILVGVPEGINLPLVRRRMERVFFNLIANALEAMPTGGQLSIGARKTGNVVLIEFEDTGPGIPHAIRERLFEPFVTSNKLEGLGLGLALSRTTVLDHGGDIWTEPASGARFVIRLPLNRGQSPQKCIAGEHAVLRAARATVCCKNGFCQAETNLAGR
jgi:signal transduction histidine kinase